LICFNANFKVGSIGLELPVLKPRFRTWQPQSRISKADCAQENALTYFLAKSWPIVRGAALADQYTRRTCPADCLQRYWNGGLICAKQNRT